MSNQGHGNCFFYAVNEIFRFFKTPDDARSYTIAELARRYHHDPTIQSVVDAERGPQSFSTWLHQLGNAWADELMINTFCSALQVALAIVDVKHRQLLAYAEVHDWPLGLLLYNNEHYEAIEWEKDGTWYSYVSDIDDKLGVLHHLATSYQLTLRTV